jgi:hypothetical protein
MLTLSRGVGLGTRGLSWPVKMSHGVGPVASVVHKRLSRPTRDLVPSSVDLLLPRRCRRCFCCRRCCLLSLGPDGWEQV